VTSRKPKETMVKL